MAELRKIENQLLLLAGLICLCGVMAVELAAGTINITNLLAVIALWFGWSAIGFYLRRRSGRRGDPFFLPLAALLSGIGLIMVLRLRPELFAAQAMWIAIGLGAFFLSVISIKNVERLSDYKYIWGLLGVGLLLIAIVLGVDIGGHKSWVIIGPVRFQPSEFAKLFIVLFLAGYLNERRDLLTVPAKRYGPVTLPQPRFIAPLVTIWGLAMIMFVWQRDLGSALLFFGLTVVMTYIASGKTSYVIFGLILFLLGSFVCYKLYPHVRVRVDIWLNPWADPNGQAFQVVQSLFALGSGGILGSGLTYGYPNFIPEVHTDFIFAAIGEELGLMGAAAVLLLYICFIYRAFRVALTAGTPFTGLLAGGLATAVGLQVFLIVGGVIKFFPLTGITLPLVSYGGSSIISNFILIGILFAISEMKARNEY